MKKRKSESKASTMTRRDLLKKAGQTGLTLAAAQALSRRTPVAPEYLRALFVPGERLILGVGLHGSLATGVAWWRRAWTCR